MPPRSITLRVAEHARNLVDLVLAMKHLYVARGDPAPGLFRHYQMAIRSGGDLRQVGDDQHLVPFADLRERFRDLAADFATDALVHLVEDHGRHRVVPGQDHPERERKPRQLTA